jgi:hypothetical protein
MSITRLLALLPLLGSLALHGCGSGSTTYAEGGVSGTGITAGTTNGFGSIIVNGSRHVTDTATFARDGEDASIGQFRVGEVVLVEWALDDDGVTRYALNVTYESEIKGKVTSDADTNSKSVRVVGQLVHFDEMTVFIDNASSASPKLDSSELVAGDFVEVSGFRRADDSVQATLIELQGSSTAKVQLNGVVDDSPFNPMLEISVGGQLVEITGSTQIVGGELERGGFVRVRGSYAGGSDKVTAEEIKIRPAVLAGKKGEKTEIEGLVTAVRANSDPDAADFDVSGLRVITNSQTEYKGDDVTGIAENTHVEIEGSFGDDGSLLAEQINFLPAAEEISIKLEADVNSIEPNEGSFTLRYGSRLIKVAVNPLTQFEDTSDEDDAKFNLDKLQQFEHVEVRGYTDTSVVPVVVTATRVERKEPDTKRKLQGPATIIDPTPSLEILSILDIAVDTSTVTEFDPAPRATFFLELDDGEVVSAGGRDNGSVRWDELELEDN